MQLYYCYDKVSKNTKFYSVHETDAEYIRFIAPRLAIPFRDLVPFCAGKIIDDPSELGAIVIDDTPQALTWDLYSYPENKMEALSPLGLSEKQKEDIIKESVKE